MFDSLNMNRTLPKWLPCLICCCLLFFAATADFVSTSVVTGGFDANHPPVKIEHKCVSHSVKAIGLFDSAVSHSTPTVAALPELGLHHPEPASIVDGDRHLSPLRTVSQQASSPLRC